MKQKERKLTALLSKLLPVLFWLLCWQLGAKLMNQPILLVSPLTALRRFWEMIQTAAFWQAVGFSLGRILLGYGLSLVFSIALAALAHRFRFVRSLLSPLVGTVKAVPVASFVILVLFWTSSRNLSVIISMLIAFPVIYSHTLSALETLNSQMKEMAQLFHIPPLRRLRYIVLPQLLPSLRSALSVALGMCFKSGIAAEIIGIPRGSVGEGLYQAKIYLDSADLFAWTLTIVLLSAACELLLKLVLKALERGSTKCLS